ncbi:unnamed protein product [Moneuplotes crassus]|uniref:Uncharacterized protein n=1 Tax=Euplotes crassus TaxID=5936 RepID=A0AAD1XT45_EUPCR|nr:unnamed protein product [Moneuplotes crassus]
MNNFDSDRSQNPFQRTSDVKRKRRFNEMNEECYMDAESTYQSSSPSSGKKDPGYLRANQKRRVMVDSSMREVEQKMIDLDLARESRDENIKSHRINSCLKYTQFQSQEESNELSQESQKNFQEESMQTDTTKPIMIPKKHYYSLKGDIDYLRDLTKEQMVESIKVQAFYADKNKAIIDLLRNE